MNHPLKSLTLTHILQIDFAKRPEEGIAIAGCFTVSTVPIPPTGGLKKLWVEDTELLAMGLLTTTGVQENSYTNFLFRM